jgi:hypothetical protein
MTNNDSLTFSIPAIFKQMNPRRSWKSPMLYLIEIGFVEIGVVAIKVSAIVESRGISGSRRIAFIHPSPANRLPMRK